MILTWHNSASELFANLFIQPFDELLGFEFDHIFLDLYYHVSHMIVIVYAVCIPQKWSGRVKSHMYI